MSITSIDEHTRSRPHRRVERILDGMGVSHESEWTEFAPYSLDIWLPEVWAAIEVDGPSHSKKKDAKRDGVLMAKYGVMVLRLPVDVPIDEVKHSVVAFTQKCGGTYRERREIWRAE